MATLNYRKIRDAVAAREAFEGNSMRAVHVSEIDHVSAGQLDVEETKILRSVHGPAYVVYSYRTPIAWIPVTGMTRIVEQHFSVTTSRHQGIVRAWL